MVEAIKVELRLRAVAEPGRSESETLQQEIKTIYFGGGTPSLLTKSQVEDILQVIDKHYQVAPTAEITLEANPDDLTVEKVKELSQSPINRLSIGVQSFFEEDLKLMNRAHNAQEALDCIKNAREYFENISIDLIYGIPGMDNERWRENLYIATSLNIPHISSYALTVEDHTALKKFIATGIIENVDDEVAQGHFNILLDVMQLHGYENYEFSNFGKPGYFSQNNTAYWTGKSYLGIGPSAHGYDGKKRSWNINNNIKYIKSIKQGILPQELEILTTVDRYNEYIMTGLRTIYGVSLEKVTIEYGPSFKKYLLKQADEYLKDHLLFLDGDKLLVTRKGKFLSDGIASALFMLNLT
jgi:oxygen-independent coproporphyrinogen-3 oxidase